MLATIKWNSRYNAREWVMMAGALVVQLSALNAKRQKTESKPRRPLWKHFDDTHHWDFDRGGMGPQRSSVIVQRIMGPAGRIPRLQDSAR